MLSRPPFKVVIRAPVERFPTNPTYFVHFKKDSDGNDTNSISTARGCFELLDGRVKIWHKINSYLDMDPRKNLTLSNHRMLNYVNQNLATLRPNQGMAGPTWLSSRIMQSF